MGVAQRSRYSKWFAIEWHEDIYRSSPFLACCFILLFKFSIGSDLLAFAAFRACCCAVFYLYLRMARQRRIAAFSEQLPDALDVIVRGLRAGHPFRVALGFGGARNARPVGIGIRDFGGRNYVWS